MGLFGIGGAGGSEAWRIGRNVAIIMILSVAAALLLTYFFKLDVRSTALALITSGVAPPILYLSFLQTVGPRDADEVQADGGRTLTETVLTDLALTVLKQWDKEYGMRTYNDPAQKMRDIRASWSAARPPLVPDWDALIGLARGVGAHESMRQASWAAGPDGLAGLDEGDFRKILGKVPTGWLTVLGESGSGKTMLMLRTVREIAKHGLDTTNLRDRKNDDPVPLFVPMTSWNPDEDTLREWLERQLPIDYPGLSARVTVAGKRTTVIGMLLDQQKIIPILDGLDEMAADARAKAVSRLNEAFTAPARPLWLVVTCRTKSYRRTVEKSGTEQRAHLLLAAAAIELHPLDPDKVSAYLANRGKDRRWAKVNAKLVQPSGVLAEGLNTPLYASLASEIYNPRSDGGDIRSREPGELADFAKVESLHHHLLDEFIPAVYAAEHQERKPDEQPPEYMTEEEEEEEEAARRDRGKAASSDQSASGKRQEVPDERWLMFLANYLTPDPDKPTTSLLWWNLSELAPWLAPAFVGVVCGVATAVAAATGTNVGVGIGIGFGTGMLIAVAIGFAIFNKAWDVRNLKKDAFEKRYKKRSPGWGMTGGMIGAVIGGVLAGVAGQHHIGHTASLFSAVPEALGMALGAGATTDFLGGLIGVFIGAFAGGYLAAVGLGLPAGLVNGIGVGVAVALVVDVIGRDKPSRKKPKWVLGVGLLGGGVIGVAIGLTVWREAGPVYGIACGVLMAALAAWPFGLRHMDENLNYVPSPSHSLDRDVKAFRLTAVSAGLAAGAAGFIGGSMTSITEVHAHATVGKVISDGLGIGIASGLVVGLTFGFYHAASPEFRIVTWWLALHRQVPWRFRRFLDHAYKLTVLRQVGATYQFRHVELQKRLAERYRDDLGKKSASGPRPAVEASATKTSSDPALEAH